MDRKTKRKLEREMNEFQEKFENGVEQKVQENLSEKEVVIDKDAKFEGNVRYQVEVFKDGRYTVRRETTPESQFIGFVLTKDAMNAYVETIKEKLRTEELKTEDVDPKIIESLEVAMAFLDESIAAHIPYIYEKNRVISSLSQRNISVVKTMPSNLKK